MARPDTLQLAQWPSDAALPRTATQAHVVHVTQCLSEGPLAFVMRVIAALDDIRALAAHLAESGRWTEERALLLVDDVAATGPLAPVA